MEYNKFFFGAETNKQQTLNGMVPSATFCWKWVRNHKSIYGPLTPLSRDAW